MSSSHMAALALTLGTYTALAVAYFGWGKVLARALHFDQPQTENYPVTFFIWSGWSLTLCLFHLIHFVFPLNAYAVAPVFALGIVFSIIYRAAPRRSRPIGSAVRSYAYILVFVVVLPIVAAWVASRAMLSPMIYDSGLYHFNTIRWLNAFPIIPGLGNLHGRLAFNHAFFPYVAALNFDPYFNHGRSLANSFLLLLATATSFELLIRGMKRPCFSESNLLRWASALFVLPILVYLALSSYELASPSPDLTSQLLQLVMFMIMARAVGDYIEEGRSPLFTTTVLGVLTATAITIKLSNLAFSAVVVSLAVVGVSKTPIHRTRAVIFILLPAALILLVWGVRGWVLSGAPLYPSTVGYIAFDWAVPVERIVDEANWVYSWARHPDKHWRDVLGSWDWFEPWTASVKKRRTEIVFPLATFLVFSTVSIFIVVFCRREEAARPRLQWLIVLPLIAGLVFWFFTAPDPRFANAVILLLPVSVILGFLCLIRSRVNTTAFAVIFCIVFLAGNYHFLENIHRHPWKITQFSKNGWHAVKKVRLTTKVTDSGLNVFTPKAGDQCWDAPLPCTPNFEHDLRLRKPSDMASGFSVQMR